jgi:hypothetical protein
MQRLRLFEGGVDACIRRLPPLNWRCEFATRYDCVEPRRMWQIQTA